MSSLYAGDDDDERVIGATIANVCATFTTTCEWINLEVLCVRAQHLRLPMELMNSPRNLKLMFQ